MSERLENELRSLQQRVAEIRAAKLSKLPALGKVAPDQSKGVTNDRNSATKRSETNDETQENETPEKGRGCLHG